MNKNNKRRYLLVFGPLLLVIALIGVTYAFFNYTRTGSPNTLQVGRIAFNSTQTNIELENIFPTLSANLNSNNSDTATITITGDTTYSEGIEYKVTIEAVNNTINGKEVPISIRATATNLGTEDSNYYTNRENKTKIYKLNSEGEAYNGKYIAVGYIPEGSTGVNGSIDITAFIDTNKIAITDTYLNETDEDWVMGREVFTTSEWNSFNSSNSLSFKVRVEAQEGIWVEKEKLLTMKNLNSIQEWKDIRANITGIEFRKDGVAPENSITSFNVTDETSDTSKGNIMLYTVDDGLGNSTYKAIIVANDMIYAPEDSSMLFMLMSKLTTFNSRNFRVDNVTNMAAMLYGNSKLSDIKSLSMWNTSNVTNMLNMFCNCTGITTLSPLSNWNTANVTNMAGMFSLSGGRMYLTDISALANWNTSNVTSMVGMFDGNLYLTDISALANWDVSNVTEMVTMFRNLRSLTDISALANWNVSNVTYMNSMFYSCSNLEDASGINNWNINASANFSEMFRYTPSHPEFTKVSGSWDSNGTFKPNAS